MQGKSAKLSLLTITALALATVQSLWGQQPTGQVRKLTQPHGGAIVHEDTQWSPDQDIQLLKGNLRSQKKQIVAVSMDLTERGGEVLAGLQPLRSAIGNDLRHQNCT